MDEIKDIRKKIDSLNLYQKLGQMFLQNFVGKDDVTPEIKELNNKGLLGGIIFFSGSNVEDIEQLKSLTEKIQNLIHENPIGIPYFTTLDQEGGQLSALHRGVTIFPGNMALGSADDENLTYEYAKYVGQELKYAGININFAPVLDVSYESKNGINIVDNRMISSDTEKVSRIGCSIIRGIQETGVMACAKHFPGMKISEIDTHHQKDIIDYSLELMKKEYLPPFIEAVKTGVGAIMTHHGIYSVFDDKPATLSKPTLDFLRNEMEYNGLIISDDLIMKAIQNDYPGSIGCELAINAGVDQIIITGGGEWLINDLVESVNKGRIKEETIDKALYRIFTAKNNFISHNNRANKPSSENGDKLSINLSRKAVKIYKNDKNILPLKLDREKDKLGVILANPARLVMSDTVNFYDISLKKVIEEGQLFPYVKEMIMPWNPTEEEILSNFDIGFISDVLIITTVNAYRFEGQVETLKQISELRNEGRTTPQIIGVATRSSNDIDILKKYCDAVLFTAGITPNLITALIEKIFGKDLK